MEPLRKIFTPRSNPFFYKVNIVCELIVAFGKTYKREMFALPIYVMFNTAICVCICIFYLYCKYLPNGLAHIYVEKSVCLRNRDFK